MKDLIDDNAKQAMYLYYKMAKSLRSDAIETLNSLSYSYSCCDEFRMRYLQIREGINSIFQSRKNYGKGLNLPKIRGDIYTSNDDLRGMMSSVIMSSSQVVSFIEGMLGSFDEELTSLKKKNKSLEQELKKLSPAIPQEIMANCPQNLLSTINELNIAYNNGLKTSSVILFRKILSDSIDKKYRMTNKYNRLIDPENNKPYDLPKQLNICATDHIVSQNVINRLLDLKIIQDATVHNSKINPIPKEIESMKTLTRVFLEELFSD